MKNNDTNIPTHYSKNRQDISSFTDTESATFASNLPDIVRNNPFVVDYIRNGESISAEDDRYMLSLVIQGSAVLDRELVTLKSGNVIWMSSTSKMDIVQSSSDFCCLVISFKKQFVFEILAYEPFIQNLMGMDFEDSFVFKINEMARAHISGLFESLYHEYVGDRLFRSGILKAMFVELLLKIARTTEDSDKHVETFSSRKWNLVNNFKKLVNKHFMTIRSVGQYASMLFVSAKYLSETVKELTGVTALHIIHYRISQEAKDLLSTSILSIKEVAYKMNFDSSSHFSRFFKRFTGHNPSQFLQLNMVW